MNPGSVQKFMKERGGRGEREWRERREEGQGSGEEEWQGRAGEGDNTQCFQTRALRIRAGSSVCSCNSQPSSIMVDLFSVTPLT